MSLIQPRQIGASLIPRKVDAALTTNRSGTYSATGGTSTRGQLTAMSNSSLDGITLTAGLRVGLFGQTAGAQNGIWVVSTVGSGSNGVWDRASDLDSDSEVVGGLVIYIDRGTLNSRKVFSLSTAATVTIGGSSGTSLTFIEGSTGVPVAGSWTTLVKAADQSTAAGDDDTLSFSVAANTKYRMRAAVQGSYNTTGGAPNGLNMDLRWPASPTRIEILAISSQRTANGVVLPISYVTTSPYTVVLAIDNGGGAENWAVKWDVLFTNGATAGTMRFYHFTSSSVGRMIPFAGSWMEYAAV